MKVSYDDTRYDPISKEFLTTYINAMIKVLERSPFTPFDFTNLDDEQRGFLFEICFNGLIELEASRPLDVAGVDHFCHTTFSTEKSNPAELISSQTRTWFHGAALDDVLDEVLAARAGP